MGNTTIPAELVAINAIQGTLIADNAITAVHIGQNQVHSVQLAINSVTATQIADGTITSAKIQDGTIATADIADVQITTAKLADNSVTSAKIVNASIVSADIANNAILTQHIDDNQITADQIADNAVGLGQLASLSRGSIIYGDSAGNPAYLSVGAANTLLQSDGTDLVFAPLQSGIDDNSNAVAITIDSSENVGIGPLTSSPDSRLHVFSGVSSTSDWGNLGVISDFPINNAGRIYTAYLLQDSQSIKSAAIGHAYDGTGYKMHFGTASTTTSGISTALTIDRLGKVGIGTTVPVENLSIVGTANTGMNIQAGTSHIAFLDFGDTGDTNFGGINYNNDDDTLNLRAGNLNRLTITSSGDIGIGEDTPVARLHIQDNTSTVYDATAYQQDLFIEKRNTAGNNQVGTIRFGITGHDGSTTAEASIGVLQTSNAHSGNIVFGTRHNGTRGERMRIASEGNVGIGTDGPSEKLEVNGKIRLGGMRLANNDSGRIGLNRNPDDGSTTISGLQRFQINGPFSGGDYLDFQNYNSSGTYIGGFRVDGGAIRAEPLGISTPSYSFDNDTDTGMTRPTGNTLQLVTGGTERIRIDANGLVGIGNDDAGSMHAKANKLVVGSGSAGGMAIYNGLAEGWYAFARAVGNNTDAYDGGMSYTDRVLRFHTNAGQTRFLIDASGDAQIYGHLGFEDNKLLMFGGGQDARLYFDASTNALMITASNGTANTVNITTNNFQIGGATPLISGTANDSVVINQDGASNVDFRVETDNEQYALFVDASSEIIHVGEGTNSDMQQVIPAKTLHYRRHGYHGGNRTHGGRTFKYSEGNSWTDAVKIEWNNASWGAVNMRIKGQGYYGTTDAFDVVIGFQGHAAHVGGNFNATSTAGNYTHFINIVRDTTGETTIQQRNSNNTSSAEDIVFMYEWVTNNRSDQTILVTDL